MKFDARLHWVSYNGSCSTHCTATVKSGQIHRQPTFGYHVWSVVIDNKFEFFYTALNTEGKVILDSTLELQERKVYYIRFWMEHEALEEYGNRQGSIISFWPLIMTYVHRAVQCSLDMHESFSKV